MPLKSHAVTLQKGELATVRTVTFNRENVFNEESTTQYLASRLINRLHYTTPESVIRREIWFATGDLIGNEDLEELERNIREIGLFAQVNVDIEIVEDGTAGSRTIDVLVSTIDRLSITFKPGGSVLGGVGEVSASVGEKNLLGTGHSFELGYKENTDGELLGSFSYDNVRIAASDAFAGLQLGITDEGSSAGIKIRDEFDNSDDRYSWSIELNHEETKVDYYDQGESVVEVPRRIDRLSLTRTYRSGSRSGFWRYGPLVEHKVTQHSSATGAQSDSVTIPVDSKETFVGGLLGFDASHDHVKIKWLDTLSYEQDLSLGYSVELALGASQVLDDFGRKLKPVIFLNSQWSDSLGSEEFVSSKLETAYVIEGDQKDSWTTSVVAKFYSRRFEPFTLATALRYNTGFSGTGLPAEQSLGENNGLRGYPAREFNGEQSVLLNLEGRFRTPIQLLTFDIGGVVFLDTGWVGDRGQGDIFRYAHSSAGFGARIGSSSLFGSGVFRLDVAFPLEDDERGYKPLVSLSLGQVFGFN